MTTVDRKWYDKLGRTVIGFLAGVFCIPIAVIALPFALAYWLAYIEKDN